MAALRAAPAARLAAAGRPLARARHPRRHAARATAGPAKPLVADDADDSKPSAAAAQSVEDELAQKALEVEKAELEKDVLLESKAGFRIPESLKLASYIFVWYSAYLAFNIASKKLLGAFPMPFTVHALYVLIGCVSSLAAVSVNLGPGDSLGKVMSESYKAGEDGAATKQGVAAASTHAASLVALSGMSLSFAHTVKASEPFISAGMNQFIWGNKVPLLVWLAVVPVVFGVAFSSFSQGAAFSLPPFMAALVAVVALVVQNTSCKTSLNAPPDASPVAGRPARMYARLLLRSAPFAVALAAAVDGYSWLSGAGAAKLSAAAAKMGSWGLASYMLTGGLAFFVYNQMSFACINIFKSPLTASIGNVSKRVFVVIASVFVLGAPISQQQVIGFSIAMAGVVAYTLAQDYCSKAKAAPAPVAASASA